MRNMKYEHNVLMLKNHFLRCHTCKGCSSVNENFYNCKYLIN